MKIKNILIGSLLTLSITLQAEEKKGSIQIKITSNSNSTPTGYIGMGPLVVTGTILYYIGSGKAIKHIKFLSKLPPYQLITRTAMIVGPIATIETINALDTKDQKEIAFLTEKYGDSFFKDYSSLKNHSTCTSFSHDPYKWLKRRYNAPRYTESKVSPSDVNLGGLIDQW